MKIILAPDSFKGSISAAKVCEAMEEGIRRCVKDIDVVHIPMADGGEGTVHALVSATGGEVIYTSVIGPLGEPVRASWGILGDGATAVIEMASASGLPLIPEEKRNPLFTTTFGTGQLLCHALERGCRKIIVGIGGSATTDFGTGMAQALGVTFFSNGKKITQYMNGDLMGKVTDVDVEALDSRIRRAEILVACDVENPLLGEYGAVYTYSPQKGADLAMCRILEANMRHIADVAGRTLPDVRYVPGAGAAGGLGAGLMTFANATLQPGVQIVLETTDFSRRITGADLIFTGEGKIDSQTAFGKTISGVAAAAREKNIPVIAIAGMVDVDGQTLKELGITAGFSICNRPLTLDEAVFSAKHLVSGIVEEVLYVFLLNNC
ncbi:glycerate kinase [candidate division KSB1 bacterium]|nr:glycerate kinase [candidate division KSB1 bacterium]